MNKTILAFYINNNMVDEIDLIRREVIKSLEGQDVMAYFIPTSGEQRVDCVYPKFIASDEFIKSHEKTMEDISNKFNKIIKIK